MESVNFKTTIKCSGCIANVTPYLNKTVGDNNWVVDTETPDKILTVTTHDPISEEAIITAVQEAGYKAERIK